MIIRTKFVKVVAAGDEFFDPKFLGRFGRIIGRSMKNDLAGVGDTPRDPAYLIRFGPAYGEAACTDLFWTEELRPVPARRA
jgi:hypothetical protein